MLEFFKQSECVPPVEEGDITAERKHRCKLSIMGELSFHSLSNSLISHKISDCVFNFHAGYFLALFRSPSLTCFVSRRGS